MKNQDHQEKPKPIKQNQEIQTKAKTTEKLQNT